MLPFTVKQFYEVFAAYNAAIWPAPLVVYGFGLLALGFLFRPGPTWDRATPAILGAMWLWTGVAYHWLHFASINPAARLFGAAFVVQGLAFLYAATQGRLVFDRVEAVRAAAGGVLIGYALVLYPLLGIWLGHRYAELPLFGVTPCPLAIFTFGCLLLTRSSVPWWMLIVPVLWSLIGGSASFLLKVPQDWMLLVSGAMTVALINRHKSVPRAPASPT